MIRTGLPTFGRFESILDMVFAVATWTRGDPELTCDQVICTDSAGRAHCRVLQRTRRKEKAIT